MADDNDSGIPLDVSRETAERLKIYVSLVRKWQPAINLIAPSTLPFIWTRHITDSLQIGRLRPEPLYWADLGSGAGFPGLVTAILLAEGNAGHVHLIESNNKKASFLRQVIAQTGARASVHADRIEAVLPRLEKIEAVSARALSSLTGLLDYCDPIARRNEKLELWFHKGLDYAREIEAARGRYDFHLIEHPSPVESGSVLLCIRGLKHKD